MRDLPASGFKPMSPALAGGFFTTEPPAKPPRTVSGDDRHTPVYSASLTLILG